MRFLEQAGEFLAARFPDFGFITAKDGPDDLDHFLILPFVGAIGDGTAAEMPKLPSQATMIALYAAMSEFKPRRGAALN